VRPSALYCVVVALAVAPEVHLAGGEGPLDRLKSLLEEKRRLEWENATLSQELAFAATPSPYIFVDLRERSFEFRVRGRAHKTYRAEALEVVGADGERLTAADLRAAAPDPLEVQDKAGGPPEVIPPAAEGGDKAAPSDPNASRLTVDAQVLGVSAPTDFDVILENGVRLEIRTRRPESGWQRARDALSGMARGLASTVKEWLRRDGPASGGTAGVALRATLDEATARAFYHSLLPGERIYFIPLPPPPLSLVASLGPGPRTRAPGPRSGEPDSPRRQAQAPGRG